MFSSTRGAAALACLALALGVAACGDDDSDSGGSSGAGTTTGAAAEAAAGGGAAKTITPETIAAALEFTGGEEGEADASLKPVTFGYVNQEGGAPSFPEYHGVTSAAVDFVNEHLGGIGGHPLKLEECIIQAEEDGQKCAAEFRGNPDVSAAILGLAVVGNQSFYKTVDGQFPVIVDVAATGPDATSPKVYSLDGGAAGVLNAEAEAAVKVGAKTVALLTANNPAGKNTSQTVQAPRLKELGIDPKIVLFEDTATTPDFVTTLTNAGAATADAITFNPSSNAQCNQIFDALKQLGIETPVIASVFCGADEVVEHTGEGLNGWVMASFGWNPRVPGNAQSEAYENVMAAAGKPELTNAGYTFKSFADVLALTKLATEVGADKVSGETMNQAILDWRGPGYMQAGPMKCGWNPATIGVCGTTGQLSEFKDNQWKDVGVVEVPGAEAAVS